MRFLPIFLPPSSSPLHCHSVPELQFATQLSREAEEERVREGGYGRGGGLCVCVGGGTTDKPF